MRNIDILLLFLFLGHCVSAQKPAHLEAVAVTKMVPVDSIDNQDTKPNSCSGWVDTNIRFTACLNAEGIVGYLLEPKDDSYLKLTLSDMDLRRCGARLREVQRAEALFAKALDLRCDSAQEILRAFTAPRFYEYIRQYVFYTTTDGDTCVHINCVMPDDESLCPPRPSYVYVVVCDGDDYYWTADLNLSKERLVSYHVNGPTLYFVEGRNKEPQGLYSETIFARPWLHVEHECRFDQLPTAVQETLLSQMDTARITYCKQFSPKYVWGFVKKKNGKEVAWRKHYKSGNYYQIYSDTLCFGYNAKGRMLYIAPEEDEDSNQHLGRENLNHIDQIDTMMATIARDLSARGRDYAKYGSICWAEQVGDHYVLAVIYNAPIDADDLHAYYTFDRNGRLEGVALRQF